MTTGPHDRVPDALQRQGLKLRTTNGFARVRVAMVVVSSLLCGRRPRQEKIEPSIEFSQIPPAAQGGRERVDTISGRVTGARRDQQIVVYARSGRWWVQPWPDHPQLPIRSDSTWSTPTHLGFEYASLLVEPGYQPAPTMDVLSCRWRSRCCRDIGQGLRRHPARAHLAFAFQRIRLASSYDC